MVNGEYTNVAHVRPNLVKYFYVQRNHGENHCLFNGFGILLTSVILISRMVYLNGFGHVVQKSF